MTVYSIPGKVPHRLCSHSIVTRTDLKNTTDDALPNYLTSLKFTQSHLLTDVRLALGYSAVIVAAITFYADYKFGWDNTKYWTFWAVLVYFTLNGALTFWIWGVEKGKVFTGEIDHPSVGRVSVRGNPDMFKYSSTDLNGSSPLLRMLRSTFLSTT